MIIVMGFLEGIYYLLAIPVEDEARKGFKGNQY